MCFKVLFLHITEWGKKTTQAPAASSSLTLHVIKHFYVRQSALGYTLI